jgi:hypothetical protein
MSRNISDSCITEGTPFPSSGAGLSNRALRGRKHDFKDAERLAWQFVAKELIGEQRIWGKLCWLAHLAPMLFEVQCEIDLMLNGSGRRRQGKIVGLLVSRRGAAPA